MKVTGSATPSSPLNLQYTGPVGLPSVVVHYTNYYVKTNFGCSGVGDYGGSGGTQTPLASDGGQDASCASLTIRVPATRFEETRVEIGKLGLRVESEKLEAQDVTKQ